ncbi:MAG: hypothetical protein A2937_03795 [Candidatus Yonathbacteria bacterium RIFCSPLOWO2_01_FULL_47_33b]|uniref:Uncharacterized protein n=1 Tax=Candidatus Yonathbacteria bacterium RIFCSPLOWO2_01_FULL_47_33b TaxID=1802727 RepID=A0A1G2SEK5_9BACT|nr:MAG: hypothetical protein A2937_03795 [Candidatus Yonathbacteria bacterium RIFCSPLOWO2_01_FULL_47_33b]
MIFITIDLPSEITPGSQEAEKFFRKKFAQLGKGFQIIPSSYNKLPGKNDAYVTSFMAVSL